MELEHQASQVVAGGLYTCAVPAVGRLDQYFVQLFTKDKKQVFLNQVKSICANGVDD